MSKERKANEMTQMISSLSIHGVNKIDVQDIKDITDIYTRVIRIETGNGYLELTCFSDIKKTLKIKSVVKTEVHNVETKELRV